jgi:hypothetical protein
MLNYETVWMSRDELVDSTYEAALELNRLKHLFGLIDHRDADTVRRRIEREAEIVREIDGILAVDNENDRARMLKAVLRRQTSLGGSTICRKDEMNWPTRFIRFNPLRVIRGALARG